LPPWRLIASYRTRIRAEPVPPCGYQAADTPANTAFAAHPQFSYDRYSMCDSEVSNAGVVWRDVTMDHLARQAVCCFAARKRDLPMERRDPIHL